VRQGHQDSVAAPQEPEETEDAGWSGATPVQAALDRGAVLCMDEVQAPAAEPMGIPSGGFPRICTGFSDGSAAQAIS